jgi:hypothetical protein
MIATTIELETMLTQRCPACGTPHRIRAAIAPDVDNTAPDLVGFFGRCPETGLRSWLVVEVPVREEGTWVVAFGPPDDDTWEPLDHEALERTWRSWPEPSRGAEPGPLMNFHPRRAGGAGGFRESAGLLREALGCPFRS